MMGVLSCSLSIHALDNNYKVDIPNIPYLSPEAASLGKYGEIPVSEFTGVPQIDIPLYTVKSGELELPISLNYHASGIKVSQEATWVGLGWDLLMGGCITYHVQGDYGSTSLESIGFFNKYFPETNWNYQNYPVITNVQFERGLQSYAYNTESFLTMRDYEQDIFQANFCGKSMMFIVRNNPITHSWEVIEVGNIEGNNRIQFSGTFDNRNMPMDNVSWTITDNEGIRYTFGAAGQEGYNMVAGVNPRHPQTWFLTEIVHPTKGRICFNYGNECTIYPIANVTHYKTKFTAKNEYALYHIPDSYESGFTGHSNYQNDENRYIIDLQDEERAKVSSLAVDKIYKHYLQSIVTDNETIEFHLGNREDIRGVCKKIDYILVKNINNDIVNRIDFDYSYFDASASGYDGKRLKLNGITINDKEYNFTYESTILPSKKSFSQDFWGYYNGKNNTSLIPAIYGIDTSLADRFVDLNYIKAGMLNKITYPTGGYTEFEFEANRVDNTPDVFGTYYFNGSYANLNCVGGLRVKEIKHYDADRTLLSQDKYEYFGGKLMQPLNIIERDKVGILSSHGERNEKRYRLFETTTVYSNPRHPLFASLCTPIVGYSKVAKTCGNIKTISYFSLSEISNRSWERYLWSKEHDNYNSYLPNEECSFPNILNSGNLEEQTIMELQANGDSVILKDTFYGTHVVSLSPIWVNAYAKRLYYGGFDYLSLGERTAYYFTNQPIYRIFGYPLTRKRYKKYVEETYYGDIMCDDVIEDFTYYYYNSDHILSGEFSPQKNRRIDYNYSHPLGSEMYTRNILAKPYEIIESYATDTDNYTTIARNRFNYSVNNNNIVLSSLDWAQGNEAYSRRMTYLHDNNGNIIQATKNDEIPVSYVWSYNNTLPVMKIIGINYNNLPISIINQLKFSTSQEEITTLVNNLVETIRNNNTLVSNYTFIPLVGLASETAPNGYKTNYTYDEYGRLVEVKDGNDNTLKTFEYNYGRR